MANARLQQTEATFEPLPVDANVARAFGRLYALLISGGRKTRGRRVMDLLIAATALDAGVPLYTRNPHDFEGLDELVTIIAIEPRVARKPPRAGGRCGSRATPWQKLQRTGPTPALEVARPRDDDPEMTPEMIPRRWSLRYRAHPCARASLP